MDENKRLKLVDIGYRILPTCATCVHGRFFMDEWGTCDLHRYVHLKHSGGERQLSVNKSGTCPKHEIDPAERHELHAYREFIDG